MDTTIDLLKIKIDKAKEALSEESRRAVDGVDWKTIILSMRTEKGYSYTQLEDLETETELLLCGLINPEEYPKELEKRMGIPRAQVDELVNELNEKVFKKIREELIKNIERKKIPENKQTEEPKNSENHLESREELLEKIENPDLSVQKELPAPPVNADKLKETPPSILSQKLSGSFQIPTVETEHSLSNMTKTLEEGKIKPKIDPYREPPN